MIPQNVNRVLLQIYIGLFFHFFYTENKQQLYWSVQIFPFISVLLFMEQGQDVSIVDTKAMYKHFVFIAKKSSSHKSSTITVSCMPATTSKVSIITTFVANTFQQTSSNIHHQGDLSFISIHCIIQYKNKYIY